MRRAALTALVLVASGCSLIAPLSDYTFGPSDGGDARTDAGAPIDAGSDAGTPMDAGTDAGTPMDAGTDAGSDAGPPVDAGSDAAVPDAGPPDAGPPPAVVEVALGDRHACARLEDGSVRCWGSNEFGQLGDGTMVDRSTPTDIGLSGAVQLDLGVGISCARMSDGTMRCWGLNDRGQLGDTTTANRAVPTQVDGLTGLSDISAGWSNSCAVGSTGDVVCWGAADFFALGPSRTVDSATPLAIVGATNATQVSSYGPQCFRTTGGDAHCWGVNSSGQLGDGTQVNRGSPVRVDVPVGQVSEVSTAAFHACVRLTTGSVSCFGSFEGSAFPTPFDVGVTNVQSLAAGHQHTCLTRQPGGQVMCWGRNDNGELGIGTTEWRDVPTLVPLPASATSVAGGTFFSCAILADGRLFCWGANERGQIGIGPAADVLSPTHVTF